MNEKNRSRDNRGAGSSYSARPVAHRLEVLRLSAEIGNKTRASLDTRQREALLREQMAAIQKELGDEGSNKQEIGRAHV